MSEARAALEELLRNSPARWCEWNRIASGPTLFDALKACVDDGTSVGAINLVLQWHPDLGALARDLGMAEEAVVSQWNRMHALAWCAEQAAIHPDRYSTEIDRPEFEDTARAAPEYVQSDKAWGWGCVRAFLGREKRIGRVVTVTAAGWTRGDDHGGFLVKLVFEVLEGGVWEFAHHPRDVLSTDVAVDFGKGIADAGRAALVEIRAAGTEVPPLTGRWRILREDLPAPEANGKSATGAAARGWWFALQDKVPDPEIVVLAEAQPVAGHEDATVKFVAVNGVAAKVRAVAAGGGFDTILVPDEGSQRVAKRVVKEEQESDAIRVELIG